MFQAANLEAGAGDGAQQPDGGLCPKLQRPDSPASRAEEQRREDEHEKDQVQVEDEVEEA
jgi:hypothetical protein